MSENTAHEYLVKRADEFANLHRVMVPSCSGPCDQGRKACQTPDACEIPRTEAPMTGSDLKLAVFIVAILVGFVAFGPVFRPMVQELVDLTERLVVAQKL